MAGPYQPTYLPSEEQALSLALAQSVVDQAAWQAARASGSSQQAHQVVLKRSAGEALSRQLWQDGSLGYTDVITDGLYDVYGDFPEVCEGPHEFPSLENLRKVRTGSGDVREVVLVDHESDQGLLQVVETLSEAMAEATPQDVTARIRVVAHVVADRFGGIYDSEAALERFWQVSSAAEKRRNRSAVVLLCRLDVGSLRHRALLFKLLADTMKLPCKLVRGQVLCGAESAANVMVMVEGREHVVDLVFDPGRLCTQEQFATLVQLRKTRLDSWHHPLQLSIGASGGGGASLGAETSAVSASSTGSAGTSSGSAGAGLTVPTSSGNTIQHIAFSSGTGSGASAGTSSVNVGGVVAASSQPAAATPPALNSATAGGAPPLLPPHSSPRSAPPRPPVLVPPVPVPGVYSGSLPAPGGALHGQGGGVWGVGSGHVHGSGHGPAIAGSRVRFTITDLPKTSAGVQPQGGRAESRQPSSVPAAAVSTAPSPAPAAALPMPAPPSRAAAPPVAAAPAVAVALAAGGDTPGGMAPAGRHGSLPSKARSMVDLAGKLQEHGGDQASSLQPGLDLIRLDSEPLPDGVLHPAADPASGLPPPERSGTPTGHGPGSRGAPTMLSRRQNSFDQNDWVKFSGSLTRSKDDAKPWPHHGGPGPSPLSQQSAERAPMANVAPESANGSTAPQTPQLTGGAQSQDLATSFTGHGTAAPSPDRTRPGISVGSGSVALGPHSGSLVGPSTSVPAVPAPGISSLTAASTFGNFRLPSDLSAAALCGDAGQNSSGGAGGRPASTAAADGNAGGSSGLSGRPSHASSEGSLTSVGAQVLQHLGAKLQQTQQQQQQPPLHQQQRARLCVPAASPFQAMQMGFAANTAPSPLASAFGLASQQQQLATQISPVAQMQQQQRPLLASAGDGGAGGSAPGTTPTPLPLPRMGSLPYAGQPQAPSLPQSGPLSSQQPVRQFAVGSQDSTHRLYGLGNGAMVGGAAAAVGTVPFYTPPPKSMEGTGNAGSKAPSPALSTPFTALTASSVQSTPPNSAPAENVPFAELSPFNLGGEGVAGSGSSRRDDRFPERALPPERTISERERELRELWEREQRDREREREKERERERDRQRNRSMAIFAELSPFNTGPGAAAASGAGDARDATPARRSAQQPPIVEMPSSENSCETTPRVSLTNLGDPPVASTSSGGSGAVSAHVLSGVPAGGGADRLALNLLRMHLSGPAGSRLDPAAAETGRLSPMQQQQQHLQMQHAFGAAAAMGHAAAAAGPHPAQQQQQQLPPHLLMPYWAASAIQHGNPYMYMQPQAVMAAAAAAVAAGMVPHTHGYMQQGQPGGMGHGLRHAYHANWVGGWPAAAAAAQQQQQQTNQYMMHAAYLQHQQEQQQRQQQQNQAMMVATAVADFAAQTQPGTDQGLQRRLSLTSSTTTTTVHLVDSGRSVAGPAPPPAGPASLAASGLRAAITSGDPPLALPSSTSPHRPQSAASQAQQQPLQPSPPLASPHLHQQPQQPEVDLAHEMTIPSQRRPGQLQVDHDAGGLPSPLGLQPSLSMSTPLPPSYRDLEIPPDELTFKDRIGIGSYGEVYRGTWRGTEVAIKRLLDQNLSSETIREFRDEVMIMSKLRHPNIVLFMGAVTQRHQLAIVTQFAARGSLFRLLHRAKVVLSPRLRLSMALDVAKGMEYLHNCKPVLVHRDLKSPNLLVDKDFTIKVCDFGLSRGKQKTFLTAKTQGGSPAWMAPEVLRGEPSDEKCDVFSFGVVLYELVTEREPWEDLNPMQVVGAVGFKGRRMPLPPDLDPAVTALIESCWATDPKERPSFTQILATMTAWKELRPTAEVMQRQEAATKARQEQREDIS